MATIKEIAELAGVSTTTVSNVIHGKTKRVSPETIEKINALIREVGYVQKMGLRVLSKESSQLIAVVVNYHKEFRDSLLADPFYGKALGRIEERIQKLGYYLMIYSEKDVDKIFQMVASWDIDGVIAMSFSRKNCEKIYQLTKKPVVAIDAYGEPGKPDSPVVNITLDDREGGYMMTKHLLECGYEWIKVCAGRDSGVDHQRLLGCEQAMEECAGRHQKLQFVPLGMNAAKRQENYAWLLRRLEPGTALFFLSDLYAMEAISFFHDYGVRVPEELGIAGFDNILYSRFSVPRLTTIGQDVDKKAELAVEVLMEQIHAGGSRREREIRLPVTLMVRRSTCVRSLAERNSMAGYGPAVSVPEENETRSK